jgi:hypothetical protein
MFDKARPLILATFALLFTLAVTYPLIATSPPPQLSRPLPQDPKTVSIQTPGGNGRGLVTVAVEKTPVRVRELVRFTLSPASLVNNPKLNVSVDFGDGTIVRASQTTVTHRYEATGHYKVYASVVSPSVPEPVPPKPVPPKPVPSVKLVARPTGVVAGNRVSFNAQLSFNYPGIKYRFVFGDGLQTDWQEASGTSHTYAAGGTYFAYVDLGLGNRGGLKQVGGSLRQPIVVANRPPPQPLPSPIIPPDRLSVQLTANPTAVQIEKLVTFTARFNLPASQIRYRFGFGDGSSTGWQTDSQATHAYAAPGDYPAKVEIGRWNNGQVVSTATSNTKMISVTSIIPSASPTPTPPDGPPASSTPTPPGGPTPLPSATSSPNVVVGPVSPDPPLYTLPDNWWVYLLILLLLLFVGYQLYRSLFVPRASFHPNLDMGSAEVDATATTKGLTITSQVLMRPNLSEGQYLVHTDEGNIVRSVRRENV